MMMLAGNHSQQPASRVSLSKLEGLTELRRGEAHLAFIALNALSNATISNWAEKFPFSRGAAVVTVGEERLHQKQHRSKVNTALH